MFQFLYIFGPAAITFLIVKKLTKNTSSDMAISLIALIAYAVIDAGLTMLILRPFGLVELVLQDSGTRVLRYGETAYFVALVISVIVGVVASAVDQRMDFRMTVTKKEENAGKKEDLEEDKK